MVLTNNNKLETNKYELTVKVDADEFEKGLQKVFAKQSKKISVPGFRQGKAPRKIVEKMYGEGVFFEDAINDLYPQALSDAIKEAGLDVVAPPKLDIKSVDKENGFEFTAVCVVKPEVEVKNYKGIKAEKVVKTISDSDVDERIEGIRGRNARLVDVTGRKSKSGDTVVFDFEGFADGKAFDGGKAEKFTLELGSHQFIPGFEEQVEKRAIGDEFDVNVTFPENYQAEELKGKDATFKCKLYEIKEKELPELDDEFAKDVSEFDTLTEYKADVKSKMQESADKESETELENTIIDSVIENMTGEIPEEMYESRIDDMIRDFEYRLQSQGMNLETYLGYTGMDAESFRLTFKEQAEKQVKIRLALEAIVKLEGISVTEEEINTEYMKMADAYKMEVEKVKELVEHDGFEMDLRVNKAIDLVKENAAVSESKTAAKKPAAKKAAGDADEKPAAKKPAAKKPAAKKSADGADEKPAAKKPAAKKPAAKKADAPKE